MHVTKVRATPIRIPRKRIFTSSLGTDADHDNAIVEIFTDAGTTGVGEASSVWDRRGVGEAEVIEQLLAPQVVGRDPFRIRRILHDLSQVEGSTRPAEAGIEMALLDIVGKSLGVPVYDLLGGRMRDRVALSHSLSMGPPTEVADEAESLAAAGYTTLKAKIGLDSDADHATVAAIRQRLGTDFTLRVDANMGWSSAEVAIENIGRLEPFELELIEQPVGRKDREGMRQVRERVRTPIMADESVWTPEDALACVRLEAAEIFNVYVSEAGGLLAAAEVFAIAKAAKLRCMIGSMPEFGVGTAAQAHLAFAMENIDLACDLNGFVYSADDVIQETLPISDGYFQDPPPGPGLGISLDPVKMNQYRVRVGKR